MGWPIWRILSVDLSAGFGQCQKADDIFLWRLAKGFGSFSASLRKARGKCQELLFSPGTHDVDLGFQGAGLPAETEGSQRLLSTGRSERL
ncbi:hypothetical protein [Endozoicomonas sp. ONNA2]|uniref:hypothetical protein n=1 Tax=Endozoicomonas sp. ONNA2 TaxID=2828741 RepID=UPI0021473122|nr:hypothetical protein [Endozoicomonas sp. ONNA2]